MTNPFIKQAIDPTLLGAAIGGGAGGLLGVLLSAKRKRTRLLRALGMGIGGAVTGGLAGYGAGKWRDSKRLSGLSNNIQELIAERDLRFEDHLRKNEEEKALPDWPFVDKVLSRRRHFRQPLERAIELAQEEGLISRHAARLVEPSFRDYRNRSDKDESWPEFLDRIARSRGFKDRGAFALRMDGEMRNILPNRIAPLAVLADEDASSASAKARLAAGGALGVGSATLLAGLLGFGRDGGKASERRADEKIEKKTTPKTASYNPFTKYANSALLGQPVRAASAPLDKLTGLHRSRDKFDQLKPLTYEELILDRQSGSWDESKARE